jgi:ribonuclease-3
MTHGADAEHLAKAIGYDFKSAALLEQALTHRSHSSAHNERLEFLGDAVLDCAISRWLFERYPKFDEGDLSRVRASLVRQQTLYEIAQRIELSRDLRLGEGESRSGGFRRPSILADAFEALIGAIALDGGFDAAAAVVERLYKPVIEAVDPTTLGKDAKTLLQEFLQGKRVPLPIYSVIATRGAAHSQEFDVECAIPKFAIKVTGTGGSRRAAEQSAARKALEGVIATSGAARKTRAAKTPT